tara:strand:- start:43 stop:642 length:600 start_codon:yes stop_codon:yes gene_type:complete
VSQTKAAFFGTMKMMIEQVPSASTGEGKETTEEKVARLRRELLESGKVAEFIDPLPVHLPVGVGETEDVEIQSIDAYLKRPIVRIAPGAFADNNERKEWRYSQRADKRLVFEDDALRLNPMNAALVRAQLEIANLPDGKEKNELLKEADGIVKEIHAAWRASAESGYTKEDTDKQIALVEKSIKPFLVKIRTRMVAKKN